MKTSIVIILIFAFEGCFGQVENLLELDKLIQDDNNYGNFELTISHQSLNLTDSSIVFENPFNEESFPLSFSIIYRDNIISLFDPGIFICHNIHDFSRNIELESMLNTKRFDYQWVVNNDLIGLSKGKFWIFDSINGWNKSKIKLPFTDQPILFEDNEYLVYRVCDGEWGGTIYFYKKSDHNIYFTEATCANSVFKSDSGYLITSSLGHLFGHCDLKLISDPTKLSNLKNYKISKRNTHAIIGHCDTSSCTDTLFNYFALQIFSAFNWNNTNLYIAYWYNTPLVTTIKNDTITIFDIFYDPNLYTHDPITKQYDEDIILTNLDFWGIGREREISLVLINKNKLYKIDWNKKH